MAKPRVWLLWWLESGEVTNLFEGLDPDIQEALEMAVKYHPELLVFIENPNASVEALETLRTRNKRTQRREKRDGLKA